MLVYRKVFVNFLQVIFFGLVGVDEYLETSEVNSRALTESQRVEQTVGGLNVNADLECVELGREIGQR